MENTATSFNNLPTEMKLLIFSFFDSSELNNKVVKVCKNWRYLCTDPFNWRQLTINPKLTKTPEEMISILNRNHFVQNVDFWLRDDFSWFSQVERHTSVRSVNLTDCTLLSKSLFSQLVDKFPNVEQVKIRDYRGRFEQDYLFEITRWTLLKSFKLITRSSSSLAYYIPEFVQKIKNLEEISLGEYMYRSKEAIIRLIELRGRDLKRLSISFPSAIDDQFYKSFATTCSNLRKLKLRRSVGLQNHQFLLLTNLPSLQILSIKYSCHSFYHYFPSVFKDAKFAHLTKLIIVACSGFDDACLKSLVKCCPKLTHVHIRDLERISDDGIRSLSSICCNLKFLILGELQWITKECVEEVVNQLPQIYYCIIYDCPLINGGNACRIAASIKPNNPEQKLTVFEQLNGHYKYREW